MVISRSKNQQVMILRNPAHWRDSFFTGTLTLLVTFAFPSIAILHAQGIIGHVVESFSKQNIPQADIGIYKQDSLLLQTTTDSTGSYTIHSEFAGRVSIRIISRDYQDYIEQDIILDGYTTLRLEHLLTKKTFDLPGITVVANKNRTSDFVKSISPGDMVLVPGNFDDPVRIAHSQPGIVLTNDQANHLSARGQSPVFNNWYLEGLQIVNPNHTSNAGTFSDLPTQYGGGVNMFSAQILGSTDVYTGLGPLSVDHATGATINMQLHETAKPEWRAKAGLIGFELGGGSKLGRNGILDVNLRYSFTGLLTELGADFGGEKIGFYDGVVSYTHQANQHKLKLFGWLGSSKNDFDQVQPPEDRKAYKDFFDIHYGNDILGAGGRYDLTLSQKTFLRSGFAYSTDHSTYTKRDDETTFPENTQLDDKIAILSSFVEISTIHSDVWHSTFGLHYTDRAYEDDGNSALPFPEESMGKFFVQSTLDFPHQFELEVGGEISRSFKYEQWNGGYRAQLSKALGLRSKLFTGIRQSIGEPLLVSSNNSINPYFTSRNVEAGWRYDGEVHSYTVNTYWQHTYHLTVFQANEANYYLPDIPLLPVGFLTTGVLQTGIANQYGVEGLWSMVPKKGWRVEVNQAVYKSERGIDGGVMTGGRYDGRYATHVSFAKEIIREKNGKNKIWNFSFRGIWNGGLWEPHIDTELSGIFNKTIAVYPGIYDNHLPAYKRIDASVSRTISTAKVRWQYKLDIQNLFSLTNIAYHYYDPFLNEIIAQKQLGIIPVLSVQASW
jgi:hypothetical protein